MRADSKITVLHVIKSLGRGGAETLLPETLKFHDRQQFSFHYIYFLPWKNQLAGQIVENGGTLRCMDASNSLTMLFKLRQLIRYIRENNIQLIHAHLPWAGIVARLAGKITGVPVIYTEHNKQERYHFITRRLNLLTMNLNSVVIAVSADVRESIQKFKPRLRASLRVVLNGVDIEKFDRSRCAHDIRSRFNIPSQALVIGTVSVFRVQKRLDLWLEIASAILRKHPDVHFVIVGDGPLKDQLYEKRAQLGLIQHVHFAGLQTDVIPYLAMFDLYMMTSVFEGLPVAMLEAMSMELPVVTTDAGGIKEVIQNDRQGLMVPVDKWAELTDLIPPLLHDRQRRIAMGREARDRVRARFSLQHMVSTLEDLYRSVHRRK